MRARVTRLIFCFRNIHGQKRQTAIVLVLCLNYSLIKLFRMHTARRRHRPVEHCKHNHHFSAQYWNFSNVHFQQPVYVSRASTLSAPKLFLEFEFEFEFTLCPVYEQFESYTAQFVVVNLSSRVNLHSTTCLLFYRVPGGVMTGSAVNRFLMTELFGVLR